MFVITAVCAQINVPGLWWWEGYIQERPSSAGRGTIWTRGSYEWPVMVTVVSKSKCENSSAFFNIPGTLRRFSFAFMWGCVYFPSPCLKLPGSQSSWCCWRKRSGVWSRSWKRAERRLRQMWRRCWLYGPAWGKLSPRRSTAASDGASTCLIFCIRNIQ